MAFSTDDLAKRVRISSPEQSRHVSESASLANDAIRFSLRDLLIAVTVIGALLGMLRVAGAFGAVLAFLATAVFTGGVYPWLRPHDRRGQQAMFDFLWGIGMPLVCFVYDPFVFKEGNFDSGGFEELGVGSVVLNSHVYEHSFVVYAFAGCQMLVFTLWLMWGTKVGRLAPFLGGFLVGGLLFAALVGVALVIPATIGILILGIGLPGLTPLITAFSYARQCGRALAPMWRSPARGSLLPLATIGFIVSFVVPLFLGLAVLVAWRGPASLDRALQVVQW